MINPARPVLREAPFQLGEVDELANKRLTVEDFIAEPRGMWTSNPCTNWSRESPFGKLPVWAGEALPRQRTKQRLTMASYLFFRGGYPECELNKPPVEQGAPHLQAMRHTRSIDFYERIIGQIDLQIRVLGALNWILRRTLTVWRSDRLIDVVRIRIAMGW
jgi:hypothetical protein